MLCFTEELNMTVLILVAMYSTVCRPVTVLLFYRGAEHDSADPRGHLLRRGDRVHDSILDLRPGRPEARGPTQEAFVCRHH